MPSKPSLLIISLNYLNTSSLIDSHFQNGRFAADRTNLNRLDQYPIYALEVQYRNCNLFQFYDPTLTKIQDLEEELHIVSANWIGSIPCGSDLIETSDLSLLGQTLILVLKVKSYFAWRLIPNCGRCTTLWRRILMELTQYNTRFSFFILSRRFPLLLGFCW